VKFIIHVTLSLLLAIHAGGWVIYYFQSEELKIVFMMNPGENLPENDQDNDNQKKEIFWTCELYNKEGGISKEYPEIIPVHMLKKFTNRQFMPMVFTPPEEAFA
jgi:hypothetical protein